MRKLFFNIKYEFDREEIHRAIDLRLKEPGADYICVADGVILDNTCREPEYRNIVNAGMFAICDSSYVPIYIKFIHREYYAQYCGAEIFRDIVSAGRHRMIFLGAQKTVLDALQRNLKDWNPAVEDMQFVELPFCGIDDFDYEGIAKLIKDDGADIVWIALGAPKQEYFMHRLRPFLSHGVMIAVGAVFKFYSGMGETRAPRWMVRRHLEFIYRIGQSPRKQLSRCSRILRTLPRLLWREVTDKRTAAKS